MTLPAQLALEEFIAARARFQANPTNTNQCLLWTAQGRAAGLGLDVTSRAVCTGGGGLTGGAPTRAEYTAAHQRWIDAAEDYRRMRREGGVSWQVLQNCMEERDRLSQEFFEIQRAYLAAHPPPPPPPPPPLPPPPPPLMRPMSPIAGSKRRRGEEDEDEDAEKYTEYSQFFKGHSDDEDDDEHGGGLTGGIMTLADYRAAKQRWMDAENNCTMLRREGVAGQKLLNCIAERDRLRLEFEAAHRAFFDPANVLQRQPPPPPPPPPPPQPPAAPPCPPSPPPPRAGMKRARIGFGSGPVSGGANDVVDLTEESDSDTERFPVHVEPDWSQFAAPIGLLRRSPIDLSESEDEYQLDYEGEDSHLGVMLRQLQAITRLLDEKRDEYFRGMTPELRDEVNFLTGLKDRTRRLYRDALAERHEFRRRRIWKNPEVNNIKPRGESAADDTGLEGMGVRTRS